jgi:hypothetical protein
MQQLDATIEEMSPMWSVSRCYKQGTKLVERIVHGNLSWKISTVRSHCHAGKDLVGAVVICELQRLAVVL